MKPLRSLIMALACFSSIPMPNVEWEPDNQRLMLAFLPVVGVVVGLFVMAWCFLSDAIGFGPVLRGAGIALVPIAVTGGIHLDGFADVVDAQASHADPARKREILKDSHLGAFACIGVACYLVLYTALATELSTAWEYIVLLLCMHVISRCESGFASTLYWGNGTDGMLTTFRSTADVRATVVILAIEFILASVGAIALAPIPALVAIAASLVVMGLLNPFAKRNFGGMSGDLAGCFLQVAEIVMLACIVVVVRLLGM